MDPCFIHLRLHTEYSLSDGLIQIDSLIQKAEMNGMPAVALTDQCNLFGVIKFYQAALKAGIKPLIGVDAWLENPDSPKNPTRFSLFCQNNQGYTNLMSLVSLSYTQGQSHNKPIMQREWLTQYNAGLIVLSGAEQGEIGQQLLSNDNDLLQSSLAFWLHYFKNRFYLELCRTGGTHQDTYIQLALNLAEIASLPVIATNDVRFLEQDDFDAHEARVCIHEGFVLADPRRPKHYTDQQYFKDQTEMAALFADIPEALLNTVELAKRCNVTLTLGKSYLPDFPVPPGLTMEQFICSEANKGLSERLAITYKNIEPALWKIQHYSYTKRLQTELDVINKMGFAGYFLIVADFTRWARENGVPVGPGRGSGPGSLVAYALKITDLDPLEHDLLFERFLNPDRVSMPDFDIDFCMEGRDRVIEYVMKTHGREAVAQIITYGTMAARAVVRDVGRVLSMSYGFVDKLAKLIPFEIGITLEKALLQEEQLRKRYHQEEDVRTLIDLAKKLEGITRNAGKHAGGVVIAPSKLTEFTPLYCEADETAAIVTQFDKDDVEAVGLVKFDFLGLRTLTIINWAVREINVLNAVKKNPLLDIQLIPMNDAPTFTMLKECKTTAVFQLESRGMKDLVKRLQPDRFEDIVALVALFRPGPLQSGMVDDFINRKHGRAKVSYLHPQLEPILRHTYGVILYQEQVMQIAQVLAGYSLGSADLLRRAMGKKKPEEMAMHRDLFCKGAVERGVNFEAASYIFDLMEKFAGYGFNKSHSASYALIAYQTAWLKAHYTAAYMSAVLSADMDNTDKIVSLVEECKILGLIITPPDINRSNYAFKVLDEKNIVYGLGALKGAGRAAIENIVEARNQGEPFTDLFDFCQRVDGRKINRRVMEALIKAGAFDLIAPHRASVMVSLESALHQAEQTQYDLTMGQHDLLTSLDPTLNKLNYTETPEWSEQQRLLGEKETLGLYLTGHPIHRYDCELNHFITDRIANIRLTAHKHAILAGIITQLRVIQTKRGDRMVVFTLDDATAQIDVICFGELYQIYRDVIVKDALVIVEGEVNFDDFNGNYRVVSREILTITEGRERFAKKLMITLQHSSSEDIRRLACLLKNHIGGRCHVAIDYYRPDAKANLHLGDSWRVHPTDHLLTLLKEEFVGTEIHMIY